MVGGQGRQQHPVFDCPSSSNVGWRAGIVSVDEAEGPAAVPFPFTLNTLRSAWSRCMEESIVASISDSYQRLAADPGLLLAPRRFCVRQKEGRCRVMGCGKGP